MRRTSRAEQRPQVLPAAELARCLVAPARPHRLGAIHATGRPDGCSAELAERKLAELLRCSATGRALTTPVFDPTSCQSLEAPQPQSPGEAGAQGDAAPENAPAKVHAAGSSDLPDFTMAAVVAAVAQHGNGNGDGDNANEGLWQALEAAITCPITLEPVEVPYIAGDGRSYEGDAIRAALARDARSPLTRAPMAAQDLLPHHTLRQLAALVRAQRDVPARKA